MSLNESASCFAIFRVISRWTGIMAPLPLFFMEKDSCLLTKTRSMMENGRKGKNTGTEFSSTTSILFRCQFYQHLTHLIIYTKAVQAGFLVLTLQLVNYLDRGKLDEKLLLKCRWNLHQGQFQHIMDIFCACRFSLNFCMALRTKV